MYAEGDVIGFKNTTAAMKRGDWRSALSLMSAFGA